MLAVTVYFDISYQICYSSFTDLIHQYYPVNLIYLKCIKNRYFLCGTVRVIMHSGVSRGEKGACRGHLAALKEEEL